MALITTALLALRGWETGVRAHTTPSQRAGAHPPGVRAAMPITTGWGGMTVPARGGVRGEPVPAGPARGAPAGRVHPGWAVRDAPTLQADLTNG